MTKGKVLVLGSNATRIEVQGGYADIGQYLNETVVPVMALIAAGYEIVLATPDGGKPTIDPVSDSPMHFGDDVAAHERAMAFYERDPSMNAILSLGAVIEQGLDQFAGLFVPGGHAPVVDLMQDADAGAILRHFHAASKPTALLCHGPIALIAAMAQAPAFRAALIAGDEAGARKLAGDWPYAGYRMTIFSASEEAFVEEHVFKAKMHFEMPQALGIAGGSVIVTPVDFAPHVVTDRELITGQNPGSDHGVAKALIEALDRANA